MPVRNSLTREDWIRASQRMLEKGGVDSVRVDTLEKEVQITRGSFYYHFKSHGELLESILSDWRARATEGVINQLRNTRTSPREQLQQLMELPLHGNTAREAAATELGIRAWARRDKQARQAIDEIDSHRLSYIESLLLQLGCNEPEARDRAWLIYACQLSQSLIQAGAAPERGTRLLELLLPEEEPQPA